MATESRIYNPGLQLTPLVDIYWSRSASGDRRTIRVLPDASTYIIFELAGESAGAAYVVGTLLHPVVFGLDGDVDRIGIRFRPGMADLLFDHSARDLTNRVAGLDEAGIQLPPPQFDALSNATDHSSRVSVIEDWLLRRMSEMAPAVLRSRDEVSRLYEAVANGASPRGLRDLTGWNERKLQRFFLEHFGAPVARLRRLCRFRRSLAALESRTHRSRAMLSTELGYSDQAHMCREFREFTGTDIGSLLAERRNVGNVQAAGQ